MTRFAPTSLEEMQSLKDAHRTKRTIVSFYPCDKWNCPCQNIIRDFNARIQGLTPQEVASLKKGMKDIIICPRREEKQMKKFDLHCRECGELVGTCYATDNSLTEYCDFHYVCTSEIIKNKKTKEESCVWKGALAINISPVDGHLGIECSCGNDTRDMRNNTMLSIRERDKRVKENKTKRLFGRKESVYIVK